MEYGLALTVLLVLVAAFVAGPLRKGAAADRTEDERRAALQAAKEAKYREIRDAELDHRMGKTSQADWRATDRELRAQAVEILRALDEVPPSDDEGDAGGDGRAGR